MFLSHFHVSHHGRIVSARPRFSTSFRDPCSRPKPSSSGCVQREGESVRLVAVTRIKVVRVGIHLVLEDAIRGSTRCMADDEHAPGPDRDHRLRRKRKSHLACALGALLGITPVYLDGLYYDRDWTPLDREQFAGLQRGLVTASRWIIDGNYASSLPIRLEAADTVLFLDLPAWACLWGIAQRRLGHGGGQHDAVGVYDRITGNFLRYIAGYRRQMAPRVRQLIVTHAAHAQVVVLRNRRAVRRYLADVAASAPATARAAAASRERD